MSNNIQGLVGQFSQDLLDQVVEEFAPVDLWMQNLNKAGVNTGPTVNSLLPTSTTVATDSANGFTYTDATSNAIQVTYIQKHSFHKFPYLVWDNMTPDVIKDAWIPAIASTLVGDLAASGSALFTSGNYSNFMSSSAAGFSSSAVTHLAQLLTTAKVRYANRTLLVKPTYFEALANSLAPSYVFGTSEIINNYRVMNNIHGFKVVEYPSLTNTGGNLGGLAVRPGAAVYAMKPPVAPTDGTVQWKNAVDPSGVSVQFRVWDDHEGYMKLGGTIVAGVAVGNAAQAYRVIAG